MEFSDFGRQTVNRGRYVGTGDFGSVSFASFYINYCSLRITKVFNLYLFMKQDISHLMLKS